MPPYSPYEGITRPMMNGTVPVPKNDDEAVSLVTRSKAALDYHGARYKGTHPAVQATFNDDRQKHVDSVADALHAYHKATPSKTSGLILRLMHSDPNLKIKAPMPPIN